MNYKHPAVSLVDDGLHRTLVLGFDPRQMMIVLLLLGACAGVGLAYDEVEYGNTYRIRMHRKADSVEFRSSYNHKLTILWTRSDPPARKDSRYELTGSYFLINNVTYKDNGDYIMKEKEKVLSTKTLEVIVKIRYYTRQPGQNLTLTFALPPDSCNIFFISESEVQNEIVQSGRLNWHVDECICKGFRLLKPCGIINEHLQSSCKGRLEAREPSDTVAYVVELEMESPPFDPVHIGTGIGVFLGALSCWCCARRCCCKKSSSKKDRSETPNAEPAVRYHQYDVEPVVPRHNPASEPFRTHFPTQPSYTATGPLIHNASTVNVPPAYSEVSAPSEPADAPAVPEHSDPVPRFELTFPSAPPLSSDSTCCDVYTSDKLNFL